MDIVALTQEQVERWLTKELPDNFYFHNLRHTHDVVSAVKILGDHEGISPLQQEILVLAAWFHDTGYTICYRGHEQESCRLADEFLTAYDWPHIREVQRCIQSTHPDVQPENILQRIMVDADAYHLSESDYWQNNRRLRQELVLVRDLRTTDREWLEKNLMFLNKHRYYTSFGKRYLEPRKAEHIAENEKMLGEMSQGKE